MNCAPICFPTLQRSPKMGATTTLIRGTLNTEHTILILLLSAMLHQRSRSTSYIVTVSASMTLFPGCLTIFWRTIRMPDSGSNLLRQYAQLGSLLRYRVLIPVADEVTGFGDKEHVPVDEHEEA